MRAQPPSGALTDPDSLLELRQQSTCYPGDDATAFRRYDALVERGEMVPPEVTEGWLRHRLALGEENTAVLDAFCAILATQGKSVPPDIEQRTLRAHLAGSPGRNDLGLRLAVLLLEHSKTLLPRLEDIALG